MLIAVATDDGRQIAQHFGRCMFFSIWQCLEGEPPKDLGVRINTFTRHSMNNPPASADIPTAPEVGEVPGEPPIDVEPPGPSTPAHSGPGLHSHDRVLSGLADVQVIISAGMGRRAVNDLQAAGKEIFITSETQVGDAVNQYVGGKLESDEPCEGHSHH